MCIMEVGKIWEEGYSCVNGFHLDDPQSIATLVLRLSLLNRSCLKLIQSKSFSLRDGWFFIKGALT